MMSQTPEGCEAWIVCSHCKNREAVDLFALARRYGPLFSLWNRRPPCPVYGDSRLFVSHHSTKAFVWPMTTEEPGYTDDLHALNKGLRGKV